MARMLLFGGEGVQVSQTIVRSTRRDRQGGLAAAVVVAVMALGAVPTLGSSMSALAKAASAPEAAIARPAPDVATVGPDGVQVTWNDKSLARHPDAMPVAHLVYRQSQDGKITQPAGGTCVGNVVGAGCVDTDVPSGTWRYYTRAVLFEGLGAVSPMSGDVTVDVP